MNYPGVDDAAHSLPCPARGLLVSTVGPLSLPRMGWASVAGGAHCPLTRAVPYGQAGLARPRPCVPLPWLPALCPAPAPCSTTAISSQAPSRRTTAAETPLPLCSFSHSTHFLLAFSISATVSLSFWTCLYLALPEAAGHFSPCLAGQLV